MLARVSFLIALLVLLSPIAFAEESTPPVAKTIPHEMTIHGDTRVDDYYWLKQREDPEVIAYLEAENGYTEQVMAHTSDFQEELFEEIKGRIQQDDATVPVKRDDFYYYTRYEDGQQYAIHCRKPGSLEGEEEVILDVNDLARDHEFYSARSLRPSPGHDVVAFGEDITGRRKYTLRFKNLRTGQLLPDQIAMTTGSAAWANDGRTVFYVRKDPVTLRSYQVWRHTLGTPSNDDALVFEEKDDTFSCYVWKTKSKQFLMIRSYHTLRSEVRYLDASDPTGDFSVFLPREGEHEYDLDHFGNHFYVRSNENATNFRLVRTPIDATSKSSWEVVIEHRDDVLLEGFEIFRDHLVLAERQEGLLQLRVRPWDGSAEHRVDFGEPTYDAWIGQNPEFDTAMLRFGYASLTTPRSTYDYDMNSRDRELRKRDVVLGGFDPSHYQAERLYATARDGTAVPISLVYRKDLRKPEGNPLLLYGYGSYGSSMDANFRSSRLTLIDRGFVFAMAHIRGGQEMGRAWYEDGKLLNKKNTFTDFIDCGRHLVAEGYTTPDMLYGSGGSAGGLLIGAVVNMAPELWHGVYTRVPFVDVITTMLDPDIPLTTGEYDEWGNPNDNTYYDYMLSYSPYDQVEAQDYPHILVTTGLHDSQVQYWEPAKWVAKLRAMKTDDNRLLLKTNMAAGHGGASGRYERYRETAFNYAFLLDLAGLTDVALPDAVQ